MIDRDEWLNALQEATQPMEPADPEALTAIEYAEMFGVGETTARRHMRVLVAKDKAIISWKEIRRVDGSVVRVRAYRLKK